MRIPFSSSEAAASDSDPRVLRAKLELILNSLFLTAVTNPLFVALMFGPAMIAPRYFGAVPLSHFWIVCTLHTFSCVNAGLIYHKRKATFDLLRMERRLAWLQLQLGLTWGASAWLLWVPDHPTNNVFTMLAIISVLWACTVTRASHMRLYLIGFATMAGLCWLRLATGGTFVSHLLTAILSIWLIYVVFVGASIRRHVAEMLQTRFSNEDMAKDLEQARDEAQYKRREAEDANRSKTAFLANMSHELRTPLNAILGFSDMIANEALGQDVPPRYRGYAKDINDSGSHLLSLINDLLDVAKIEAGRMEIDPRMIDLPQAIAVAKRLIAPKLAAKRQSLSVMLEPDLPPLFADERAFKQIVLNLLSNASKFTPESGCVALTCACAPEGGIAIEVQDNGIGIPATKLNTVFQPFAQADNRYDRASGGTGLGLALVWGLAALHGGTARIESVEGEGTRVIVYFPLANIQPNARRLQA